MNNANTRIGLTGRRVQESFEGGPAGMLFLVAALLSIPARRNRKRIDLAKIERERYGALSGPQGPQPWK